MENEAGRRYAISDLLEMKRLAIGDGYRARNDELSTQGIPFARAGNINVGFQFDNADFFPVENLGRVGNKVSQPGDVVFTSKGTVGRFALVRDDTPRFVYSPQLCFWRSLDQEVIDSRFLYYWMCSREFYLQFKGVAGQTDMAEYVSLTDQRRMHITVPQIGHQRAIAAILGALDDKIELNRRMNETLEELARTIFKSWFVDFDPVRAKADGRQPVGMDAATAAFFPSRFVESELGEIPEGWRGAGLGEWVQALSGGTPSKSDLSLWGGSLPWISPKVMNDIHADEAEAWVTNAAIGNGTRLVPSGSTLVMVRGMGLHKCVRVSQARTDVTFNQDVKALVPRGVEPTLLLLALLEGQTSLLKRVQSSGHGTGVLPSDILLAHPLYMPPADVQKRLVPQLDAMNERIAAGRAENRTLVELRDLLLPKFISGELRVPEAEKLAEAVL